MVTIGRVELGGAELRKPTMIDVARLAGVSQTAVSFVVNNRTDTRLNAQTRERIQRAISDLGYRPNLQARGLRLQRTHTLGFLTDEIASSPFAGRIIAGAQEAAWSHGRLLFVINTDNDPRMDRAALNELVDRNVDGVIVGAMSCRRIQAPEGLSAVPAVLVNCFADESARVPAIVSGDALGGEMAAQVLIDAGHRRLVHLAGEHGAWATIQRERGFWTAVRRAGLAGCVSPTVEGLYRTASGYERTLAVMRRDPAPTGLVCGNDRIALGALMALGRLGLRVPQDVSVVGYDDQDELADQTVPPLTTVALPHEQMGNAAVTALLQAAAGATLPARTVVDPWVVRRQSVAPPPTNR